MDDDPVGSLEGAAPHSGDIQEWIKQEALKREQEVQEAQRALQEEQRKLQERREAAVVAEHEPTDADGTGLPAGWETRLRQQGGPNTTRDLIEQVCEEFKDWLLEKNKQYGDSAIKPVRVFSDASDEEQLLVRLDDKISRLIRGNDSIEPDEDIMWDLCGYWILLQVVRRKAERADA